MPETAAETNSKPELEKTSSGIPGLDRICRGGLPKGRSILVCGDAGAGKTIFGVQFLVHGAAVEEEPGVFAAFEEKESDLKENVASLGWDLDELCRNRSLALESVDIGQDEITEAGQYDLEGLFVRLNAAIQAVGAKRIVLDTVETLFSSFTDSSTVRTEFRRLLRWLKEQGITTVITGEHEKDRLTRFGVEEYVSDCVIALSQKLSGQITRRYLRILKYRGSGHGTNSYPFLIGKQGIHLFPVTELSLDYPVSEERISSGIPRLDEMLDGRGFYRQTSILLSGTAGTGKTSIAASFADAACRRGEKVLYISHEESRSQIIRNMKSIGLDLRQWMDSGALCFHTTRISTYGLEEHFFLIKERVESLSPEVLVMDPVSNFVQMGSPEEVKNVLSRIVDFLKSRGITALFLELTSGGSFLEATRTDISSLMDAWLLLRDIENAGERNRGLYVLKSRGMKHSHQIREFLVTNSGIDLLDVYTGPAGGIVTGTARYTLETSEEAEQKQLQNRIERLNKDLELRRRKKEARIQDLKAEMESREEELLWEIREAELRKEDYNTRKQQRRLMRAE